MNFSSLRNKILLSIGFGALVVLGLTVYGQYSAILEAFQRFQWGYLPLILLLTLFNYFGRYLKWDYYLRVIGVRKLSKLDSLLIFFSGLAMVMTPGRLGEWLKSYLLRETEGTPISASAPVILAERLTDGFSLLLLGLTGLIIYSYGAPVIALSVAVALAFILIVQYRPLAFWLMRRGERLPVLSKRMRQIETFYESSYQLFSLKSLLIAIGLGIISWSGECIAFYLVLIGLGFEPSFTLVMQSAFILAAATILGVASMMPGGLGVADGSITGMLTLLFGTGSGTAAAATLLIRFSTLWFGVLAGVATLVLFTRRFKVEPEKSDSPVAGQLP